MALVALTMSNNDKKNNKRSVRLKGSSKPTDPSSLPEGFIDAVLEACKRESDPYVILATYSYIFCGMKINDIRERFIISDKDRPRKASREYIRQKIVSMFQAIGDIYEQSVGGHIAPIYKEKEEHAIGFMIGSSKGAVALVLDEEERDDQDNKSQASGEEKKKGKPGARTKDLDLGNSDDNRPRDKFPWMGRLKNKP
jgi:hypothetical protein